MQLELLYNITTRYYRYGILTSIWWNLTHKNSWNCSPKVLQPSLGISGTPPAAKVLEAGRNCGVSATRPWLARTRTLSSQKASHFMWKTITVPWSSSMRWMGYGKLWSSMGILVTGWIPEVGDDHPSTWDHELWPSFGGDGIFSAGHTPSPCLKHHVSCVVWTFQTNHGMEDLQQFFYSTSKRIFIHSMLKSIISHRMMDTWPYKPCQMRTPAACVLFKLRVGVRCASTRQLAKGLRRGPEVKSTKDLAGLGT